MDIYYEKYIKYKQKYFALKNQHGGAQCLTFGFKQHLGECWHDSLSMLLLQSDKTSDQFIEKCKYLNISGNLDKRHSELKILFSPDNIDKNAYLLPYGIYIYYLNNKPATDVITQFLDLAYIYIKNHIKRVINRVNHDNEMGTYNTDTILTTFRQGRSILYKSKEDRLQFYLDQIEKTEQLYQKLLQEKQIKEAGVEQLKKIYMKDFYNTPFEYRDAIIKLNQQQIIDYIRTLQGQDLINYLQKPIIMAMLSYQPGINTNEIFKLMTADLYNTITLEISNLEKINDKIKIIETELVKDKTIAAKQKLISEIKKPESKALTKRRLSTSCSINTVHIIHKIMDLIKINQRKSQQGGNIKDNLMALDIQNMYALRLEDPKIYLSHKELTKIFIKNKSNVDYFINLLDNDSLVGIILNTHNHVISLYSCNGECYLYDNNELGPIKFNWKENIKKILEKNNKEMGFLYIDDINMINKYGLDYEEMNDDKENIIEYFTNIYNEENAKTGDIDKEFNREYATTELEEKISMKNNYILNFIVKNNHTDVNPEVNLNINHSNIHDQINNFKLLNFTEDNICLKENLPTYLLDNYNKFNIENIDYLLGVFYYKAAPYIYKNFIELIEEKNIKLELEKNKYYLEFNNNILQKFKESDDYLYSVFDDDLKKNNITSENFYLKNNLAQYIIDKYKLFKNGDFGIHMYYILKKFLNVKNEKDTNKFHYMLYLKLVNYTDIKKELDENPKFIKYYNIYIGINEE
jgi:hypothetical protein